MSSLFHVKISDLSSYESLKDKKLLSSDLALYTSNKDNYKTTVKELSGVIENAYLNKNEFLKGNWSFKKLPKINNFVYDIQTFVNGIVGENQLSAAVTKKFVDDLHDFYLNKIKTLSTDIFEKPMLPSYPGMFVITTISDASKISDIYGGLLWDLVCTGAFITGVDPNDENYNFQEDCNIINNKVKLCSYQSAMPSHKHTTKSVSASSSKVSFVTYAPFTAGSQNFGKHGGKNYAKSISTPIRGSCGTSVTVTLDGVSSANGADATEEFDNRPEYQCFYIWKRSV